MKWLLHSASVIRPHAIHDGRLNAKSGLLVDWPGQSLWTGTVPAETERMVCLVILIRS